MIGQIKAPAEITATIIDVCRELVGDGRPVFVDIRPRADAAELDCFPVVERQVVEHGGEVVYGWRFWEQPGVIVEAEQSVVVIGLTWLVLAVLANRVVRALWAISVALPHSCFIGFAPLSLKGCASAMR